MKEIGRNREIRRNEREIGGGRNGQTEKDRDETDKDREADDDRTETQIE